MNSLGNTKGVKFDDHFSEWTLGQLIDIDTPIKLIVREYERRKLEGILGEQEEDDYLRRIKNDKSLEKLFLNSSSKGISDKELNADDYYVKEKEKEEKISISPFETSPKEILDEMEKKFRPLNENEILLKVGDIFSCITPNHVIKNPLSLVLMFNSEADLNIFPAEGSRITYIEPKGDEIISFELFYSGVSFTLPESESFLIVFNKKP